MDKFLNNDEERLFDLLESKDAEQLTAEELAFVQQRMTLSDYALQRRMITEATMIYPTVPQTDPLVLTTSGNRFTAKTVPLYQAIAAVAATIALFLSLWPADAQSQSQPSGNSNQLSKVDTIILKEHVTDTVIRYIHLRDKHLQNTPATAEERVVQASQLRVLDAAPIALPQITEELVRTKGSSLKNDSASRAILGNVYQSTIW
jgi:hypothetical protein